MLKGIDVSRHQGLIDWDTVKPQIDFAMIRAGFGNNNVDARAEFNTTECERLGIPYGLYWFSYALTPEMARNEAKHLIKFIGGRKVAYPLVYDFEYDTVTHANKQGVAVNRKFVIKCTEAFCSELEANGFYAMYYTNKDYYNRFYQASTVDEKYDVWYAGYSGTKLEKAKLWQTSDKGFIKGITGRVDLDVSLRNYPVIMEKNDLNNY